MGLEEQRGRIWEKEKNQTELALCYTSSAQNFRVWNAEESPVNVSVTQQKKFSIYWKTSEHWGQVQLARITPHPSIYIAISASRLIPMFNSASSDRYPIQSDRLTVMLSSTHMKPQHNCPQKALCHEKCTDGRALTLTHQQLLFQGALFQATHTAKAFKKKIMIIHHSNFYWRQPLHHLSHAGQSRGEGCITAGGAALLGLHARPLLFIIDISIVTTFRAACENHETSNLW